MTILDQHPDVCLNGDTPQRYTATTGFAGISTDAALPLSKAASVLSRVLLIVTY